MNMEIEITRTCGRSGDWIKAVELRSQRTLIEVSASASEIMFSMLISAILTKIPDSTPVDQISVTFTELSAAHLDVLRNVAEEPSEYFNSPESESSFFTALLRACSQEPIND